uniref:Cyclic nucleotide-binding domain-containing protein n=1 Tax=Spongospora subterranea TaxID=70186 RepID=A0A0H5QLS4_9EUKA|eukprot:CRZ02289.1 hypothetical protein [Spongospora subterranea]
MIVTASGGSSGGGQLNKLIRLLRGFKLMRVMKMSRIVQRIMKRIRISSAVIRLIKILVMLMFMWHCLGCFYWMIATADGSASEWGPSDELQQAPIFEQYVHAIFWAVNATMTVGTNIQPDTELQVFYTIVAIYCGLASNALVVGSIKKSIEDMDLASRTHRQDLEDVFTKLTLYECPVHLKKKIIGYFMYLQSRYLDYTSREMFVNLHPVLREDLLLDLNQKLIKQVPMFRDLSRLCTLSIIAKLHSRVYLPKEYIVIKGDKGLEMFFIVNGLVEKCSDGGAPAAVLREGDYFCENNLMTAERVASNFRALTYVETCVLDRNSFKRLLQQFPSFALTMQRHMKQNMSKKKWAKVDHVYRLTRLMHKLGGDATFSEAFTSYNQGTKAGECDFEIAKELLGSEIVAALAEPSFGPGSEVGQSQEESGRRS